MNKLQPEGSPDYLPDLKEWPEQHSKRCSVQGTRDGRTAKVLDAKQKKSKKKNEV